MKKLLLVIALMISIWGLNAQNADDSAKISAPKNLTAETSGVSTIKLTWNAVENADSYSVYLDTEVFMHGVYDTTYAVNKLESNKDYCFYVTAVDTSGVESEKSEEACAKTMDNSCPVPTGLKAKVKHDPDYGKKYKITLSWDANPEAELYAVYASSANVPAGIWVGNANSNEFEIGIDLEGQLYFSVKTICDSENVVASERCEEVSVILSEDILTKIECPENLTATLKSKTIIELTWNAVEDAKSYFVYRDGEEIANITGTTYTDENLKADTEYCYVVTSMGVDDESDASDEACATTLSGEGVEELASSFVIYPNPVETELFLATELRVEEVSIYDIYGRQQTVSYQPSAVSSIDVANLEAGVYFVKIVTSECEIVKRFVKK